MKKINLTLVIALVLIIATLIWYWIYSWWQLSIEKWVDVWKFGDSFWVFNAFVWTLTLLLIGATYFHQKETLDEQTKGIKNQNFRNFIEFLLEWLTLSISNIQVRWHNQFYWIIRWESALIWLKYSGVLYEWVQFSNIEKDSWIKHGWLIKLTEIIRSIKHIEWYIEEGYKWSNAERKIFYYRLIKDRISYNLYEIIMETSATRWIAEETKTFKNYLLEEQEY